MTVPRGKSMSCWIFLILSVLCLPCGVYSALSLTVQPGKEDCLHIVLPETGGHLSGSYDMLDDHLTATPLSVTLFDEHHDVAYTGRAGIPEGHFEIKIAHGKYMFCIGNGFESYHFENADEKRTEFENHRYQLYKDHHHDDDGYDVTNHDNKPRTVGFNIHVKHTTETIMKEIAGSEDYTKSPFSQELQDVIVMTNNLESMFNSLLDHQEYMKDRDENHDEYLDETLSILGTWAMVEAFFLIVVSCGQILYFRRVFETRRYM